MIRRAQHQTRQSRVGWTLMELVVAMSVMTLLLSAAVVTLSAWMRADRSGREHFEIGLNITRLADQFRADAHQALDVQPGAENHITVFILPDKRRVEYSQTGRTVERRLLKGDRRQTFESFDLPPGTEMQIDFPKAEPQRLVQLTLTRAAKDRQAVSLPDSVIQIETLLGRDHRQTQQE